jgi:hypothetical protein
VVPNADTISGLKYQSRRFVGDCVRAENVKGLSFPARLGMQLSLTNKTAKAISQIRKTKQLA